VRIDVWFVRDERIAPAPRTVAPPAVARAAMTELLGGPTDDEAAAGASTSIPAGTSLLGLRITDGVAEVDLSGAFASGGGSLSMLSRVAQVVYTLTGFPTVDSVRFLIDGERVESIGGEGVIVDRPLTRADVEGPVPAAP
jgi:spore germination protein GerM